MNATDILRYEHQLKEHGVPDKIAEIHASNLAHIIENNLANKRDVAALRAAIKVESYDIKKDLSTLGIDLRREISILATDIRKEMAILKKDILITVGIMQAASIGILSTIIHLLK